MKFILLLALTFAIISTEQIPEVDGILQLSRRNFQQALDEHPRLLVKFYIDSCGYCQKMKPVFIQLAQRLKEYGFVLGEVNAQESKSLAAKHDAKAYPTLKLFRNGVSYDFPNSSDSLEILFEFALQHAYGPITKLYTQEEIDLFLKRSNIAVLKYVNDQDELSNVSLDHIQVKFGIVENNELRQNYPHKYTLINKDIEKPIHYNGDIDGLSEFISTKGYPLVFSLNEEEFMKVENDKIPLVGIAGQKNGVLHKRFKYLAESYVNSTRFVIIDPSLELSNRRFEYLIKQSPVAENTIYYYDYETKKTTTTTFNDNSVGVLKKAVESLIEEVTAPKREAERLAKLIKGDGQVHKLTTENFKEQVFDNHRHVFVKFYAPWCGHCQSLAPTFEKLAQELNRDDIVIAEVDHTANQFDDIPIEGYPTLYLFKQEGDTKTRKEYEGDRSYQGMKSFLERNLGKVESAEKQQPQFSEIKNEGTVIQLTNENFDHVVLNSKQDVLVKFFAPWCGHCKAMAESYKELAQNLKDNQNVLIAEMDWTAHQTSAVEIKGFPTLIFFKKGQDKPEQIKYQSARTAEALAKFIEENSSFVKKEDL
ncbi:unnamed protein product (macronuclear) [Paramecium tetraurelia]|uniref:Thioredoxin domain-containing protein n=1 Tax=Paramecium tetraurelia TaxID=5888 RepID=A0CCR5_PARTE|nr:uncharacterized protein GSPATT00037367001 [Paramecium tetraurelia]CAK68582.1 unnamed protein product [Paramecium tetraurelia]|eukprot:XP_001435979.1 hypothetical protein (macronuclear) [Paramecium tetraurelia strain d4-2]